MNYENGGTEPRKSDTGGGFQVDKELLGDASAKAVKKEFRDIAWPVYENYKASDENGGTFVTAPISRWSLVEEKPEKEWLERDAEGREYVAQRRRNRSSLKDAMTLYAPLRSPEVALDLAELADGEITPEVVRGWAETYGLLGFPDEDEISVFDGFMNYRVEGRGRRDSVERFADAAGEVRTFLRIYEAVTTDGEVDFEESLKDLHPLPAKARPAWIPRKIEDRAWWLSYLAETLQMRLKDFCYVQLRPHMRGIYPTGEFTLSWGFKGLIGAVWLHMAWLLVAERDRVTRCKLPDCRRVIHFEPSGSPPHDNRRPNVRGKYKTRSDREYCKGRGCKQKYHYRKKAGWANYH